MIYKEKTIRWYWALLILLIAFAVIYTPWQLGGRELYWSEGRYAVIATETGVVPMAVTAHHELVPQVFPLFPQIAALMSCQWGMPMELSLRLISVIALFLIAILVWETARHAAGIPASAVAVAILISSNIVIEKSVDGYPETLGLLFLTTGWLAWFWLGTVKGSWNLAWIASLLFCGLAFYTIGWAGIIYFFVPLIFMRRPLTLWSKLRKSGFYIGVIILLLVILVWSIPLITAKGAISTYAAEEFLEFDDYWEHLYAFPFDVIVRFFPWSLIAWAPFCVALQPMDKNPIFNRFLRIITISLFFLLWFSPFTEPRDIILLAPPLAILTSSYYYIVIRRYGHLFQKFLKLLPWLAVIAGGIILGFYLTPTEWWKILKPLERGMEFHESTRNFVMAMVYGGMAIATGLFFIVIPRRFIPVWTTILSYLCVIMMIFWSIIYPYKAQENSKRSIGQEMRQAMKKASGIPEYVYKGENIAGLYGECFYMGCKVKKINSLDELPRNSKVVYLLCTKVPMLQSRAWGDPIMKKKYRKGELYLYKGELKQDMTPGTKQAENDNYIF